MPPSAKRPFVHAEAGVCRRSQSRKEGPVVWQVTHGQGAPYHDEEIKYIGVFSTRKKNAPAAVAYLKTKPGFRKAGGRFFIGCAIDEIRWNTGYDTWNGMKGKFRYPVTE